MPSTFRLLGLSGSLRRGSNSTAVLSTIAAATSDRADMVVADIGALPHYDQDLDGADAPEPVARLRRQIEAADALVVVSSEFNYGIPGVLKNAIDWASRPAFASPLKDKPVLVVTSSPAFTGGVRAQQQLREAFAATLSRSVPGPEVVIGQVHTKIAEGRLVDRPTLDFLAASCGGLFAEIERLRR